MLQQRLEFGFYVV